MRPVFSAVMHQARQAIRPAPVKCIGVLGLGYVGLSLAAAFSRVIPTIGFDINPQRVKELQDGNDRNSDISKEALGNAQLRVTANPEMLQESDFLIVAVPTPVDEAKRPDLTYLIDASRIVGQALKGRYHKSGEHTDSNEPSGLDERHSSSKLNGRHQRNTPIVVYESTVYPGCIEEVCIPLLEKESELEPGLHFNVGYSPERINPGDPEHTLETVVKVVSAQDMDTLEVVAQVYSLVVKAGVYEAPDIRTAEAAKVIENIQRDLNIALMNELAVVFHRMSLNTHEVLRAARTKWNFLPFSPGLVGGECIPVDPYYLTYKAEEVGYHPEVILAGRRINDGMGLYVAQETVRLLGQAGRSIRGATVLVLGIAFKENIRDLRNSKVLDLIRGLESCGCVVSVHDPLVGSETVEGLDFTAVEDPFTGRPRYDALVLAVPHDIFTQPPIEAYLGLFSDGDEPGVLIDVKGVFSETTKDDSQVLYWSF